MVWTMILTSFDSSNRVIEDKLDSSSLCLGDVGGSSLDELESKECSSKVVKILWN